MSQIITPNDLYEKFNMTVHVVEENVRNCTKAVFIGVPQDLGEIGLTIKAPLPLSFVKSNNMKTE